MKFVIAAIFIIAVWTAVDAASIGSIAQNVISDVVTFNANLAAALPNAPKDRQSFDINRSGIPIGGAVDLYYRYGFFSLSVRVVPRDDPGSWLVREPTTRIFEEDSVRTVTRSGPNSFAQQPFEISLCDDAEELKEAFFRNFQAEGIAQPHKLYTGSWRTPTMAKYLGISVDALAAEGGFVLIKLAKNSGTITLDGNPQLRSGASDAAGAVRAGDPDSVLNFIQKYGSHYVQSVTVGDAIYQVLALTRENMDSLKAAVGRRSLTVSDWNRVYDEYLAPWKVRETGTVQVASGDIQLSRFVEQELRLEAQFGSYGNLVGALISSPEKVRMLESLGKDTTAVIGMNFASLKGFIGHGDIQTREFYDEIVDTNSALWEANL